MIKMTPVCFQKFHLVITLQKSGFEYSKNGPEDETLKHILVNPGTVLEIAK